MKYRLIFTTTILLLIITAASHAATIYVDVANQGAADGSQAKPFNAIQSGIDAAVSGDTVQVAAGVYEGPIQFKDGITLQGAGAEVTKITITAPDDRPIITVSNAKSGVIDGFTIDGGGTINNGFNLSRSTFTITNNVVTNMEHNGLYAWSSTPTISNNQFIGNPDIGIRLKRSNAVVTDNVISENRVGIVCEDRANATITNNEIALNQNEGINLSGFSAPTIRNNQITDNGQFGILASSARATIEENTFSRNGRHSIESYSSELNIVANEMRENSEAGMFLADNSYVHNNTIADNASRGIWIGGGSPTIELNTITNNGGAGVICEAASTPTIANNTLSFNVGQGINFEWGLQAGATVTGNQIIGNSESGIGIWSLNHGGIVITGNKISENAREGIEISSNGVIISTGVQIRDNQITDNGGSGIVNYRGRAQIRGNLITGNAIYGVWMGNEGTTPDLGTDTDPGNNAIYGNGNWQLLNDTPHQIQAVGNYWGKGTENEGPKNLIGNDGGGSVLFEPWLKVEPPPPVISGSVLSFTWPARDEVGAGPFQIAWQDGDVAAGTLSLYYDTDRAGHDGTAISGAANIPLSDPKNQYVWEPSGLPIGATYYLYAEINDGAGNLSYVYSTGSITLGGGGGTPHGTFTRTLVKGLNLISLPVRPDTPFTAQSLVDKLNATVLTKFDESRQTFVPYLPGISNDFPIEGGAGYIINVTQAKSVTFTGTVWDNVTTSLLAPPLQGEGSSPPSLAGKGAGGLGPVWAFVVGGEIRSNDFSRSHTLTVRNLRTGEMLRYAQNDSDSYAVAFADLNRRSVVEAGDILEVGIDGIDGRARYTVTGEDLRRACARIDLSPSDWVPSNTRLLQNYPNPFNPETWIPYQLSETAEVALDIYELNGRPVRSLHLGRKPAGVYVDQSRAIYWDGRNESGERVSSGLYFYQLRAGGVTATRRMVIIK